MWSKRITESFSSKGLVLLLLFWVGHGAVFCGTLYEVAQPIFNYTFLSYLLQIPMLLSDFWTMILQPASYCSSNQNWKKGYIGIQWIMLREMERPESV